MSASVSLFLSASWASLLLPLSAIIRSLLVRWRSRELDPDPSTLIVPRRLLYLYCCAYIQEEKKFDECVLVNCKITTSFGGMTLVRLLLLCSVSRNQPLPLRLAVKPLQWSL
jgi:hypothetical protein